MVTRRRCKFCQDADRDNLEAMLEQNRMTPDQIDREKGWPSGTSSKHQRNHMGDYVNSSNPQCNFCTNPMRADFERAMSEGELTAEALSAALEMSKEQVKRHMKHHLQPLVQESAAIQLAKKEVDEIDVLSNNIQRLEAKIDELFSDDDISARYIDSLTKLAKEIRESLKYLMEFKGKLVHKRQDTIIVAQMQIVQEVLAQQHPQVWLDIKGKMEERLQ
tara:strand:+ start:2194 stop:2850 length:657 start_codon:yes stop_codon:yes gene_type:complete